MIAINSRGDFCHGKGGGFLNVNNTPICHGGSNGFMDDDTVAFASGDDIIYGGDWCASQFNLKTGWIERLSDPPTGSNHGYAGGGHAAWWWGTGLTLPNGQPGTGLWSTTGLRVPLGGLIGMGPDGAIAYKPDYQSGGPTFVRELDGSEWLLTPNHAYDLQLAGNREAIWRDTVTGLTVANLPMPKTLPGGVWAPQVFRLNGDLWLGYYNDNYGLVAHSFTDPTQGYQIVPQGHDAWAAFRALDTHLLRCVWSNSEAEQAGQLTVVDRTLGVDPLDAFLAPPTPPEPEPEPPRAPVIVVESWDSLMKAGVPWKLDTTIKANVDTNLVVTKDAADKLWLRAVNVAGSNQTGLVRQLTVEGPVPPPDPPDPEPEPEPIPPRPSTLGRFWFQPNIGSKDMLVIFNDPSVLLQVDVFSLYVQEILSDDTTNQLGPNTYPNLVAHDLFRQLAQLGIPLNIEMGSVKPYDCDAENGIRDMQAAVQRVTDAGGVVASFSMDEPLTANQYPADQGGCQRSLEQIADAVSNYMRAVFALGPIQVNWLEAWPEVSFGDHETFLSLLNERGTLPSAWHPDIDHVRAKNEHNERPPKCETVDEFLQKCQELADRYGITFGCFVNATVDPVATDREHDDNLVTLARTIAGIAPDIAQVHVAAWCSRTSTHKQDIPDNLPVDGLLQTFDAVRAIFGDATPVPPPEGDLMLATLIDPSLEVLAVKEVKATETPGHFTLILADFVEDGKTLTDKVFSQQPTGTIGDGQQWWREPGTSGAYERCTVSGNSAAFKPTTNTYYVRAFAKVTGL